MHWRANRISELFVNECGVRRATSDRIDDRRQLFQLGHDELA